MDRVRKLWISVLLGVLLIAAMVGVAGAGRNNRPHGALGPTAYITVPAAAFNPVQEGANWYNYGYYLLNESPSSWDFLAGPIVFPHSGTVQITEIVLVAVDNDGAASAEVCAWVVRSSFSGGSDQMGSVCSTGSAPDLRHFKTTSISPARVNPKWHGCYVKVRLGPTVAVGAASVRIAYRPVL
jgi:hypothetical protein